MKYMLLIYNNSAALRELPEAELASVMADVDTLMKELTGSGELVGGIALADPSQTKTIRVREGVPVISDGPFVEMKEQFAGYVTVDCDTIERAIEIAARWPDARYWAMEVRPLMDDSGLEM